MLPDEIALIFERQTTPDAHYVGIFASFLTVNAQRLCTMSLALYSLEDETTQDADEHISSMEFVLGMFSKCFVALFGNNCSTNRAIFKKIKLPLTGCSGHCFQSASNEVVLESTDVVEDVHKLMVKFWKPLLRAKFQRHTYLKP